jgi:hypothetical protein
MMGTQSILIQVSRDVLQSLQANAGIVPQISTYSHLNKSFPFYQSSEDTYFFDTVSIVKYSTKKTKY